MMFLTYAVVDGVPALVIRWEARLFPLGGSAQGSARRLPLPGGALPGVDTIGVLIVISVFVGVRKHV